MYDHTVKGFLPAAALSAAALDKLQEIFSAAGSYVWEAEVGTGGDKLGITKPRPSQTVTDWGELVRLLSELPRIDHLTITAEITGTGVIAIAFRNYLPAGGSFVITGGSPEWIGLQQAALEAMFSPLADREASRLYNRWLFGAIQTVIPLTSACILVMAAAFLITPRWLAHSDYIWWLTAATVMATLWLARLISDRFVLYIVDHYPYLRWR